MKKVLSIMKPIGVTPLEIIERLRETHPEYKTATLGYAGRLDPMAEGILLVLVNEENLKRKEYERLPKIYECEVIFGLETDTYDTLGIIQGVNVLYNKIEILEQLQRSIPSFLGTQEQQYPPFSSPRVNGKPLFYWAREGKLNEITIPSKTITIHSIDILQTSTVTVDDLTQTAIKRTYLVKGLFRQEETRNFWKEKMKAIQPQSPLLCVKLKVSCSSGTYIRSLAHELGKKVKTGAIALSIKRTKVGECTLDNALQL